MTTPIENITIDDVTYAVSELPEPVQQAVQKYEEWRERYALAQDEVQLVGSALRDLGANIVAGVRQSLEETAAPAEPATAPESPTAASVEAPASNDTLVVEDDDATV